MFQPKPKPNPGIISRGNRKFHPLGARKDRARPDIRKEQSYEQFNHMIFASNSNLIKEPEETYI